MPDPAAKLVRAGGQKMDQGRSLPIRSSIALLSARIFDKAAFLHAIVSPAEAASARLPRSHQIAAATNAEVLVGDGEAVLGIAQQGQAPPRYLRHAVVVQQQAKTRGGTAADPATKLV